MSICLSLNAESQPVDAAGFLKIALKTIQARKYHEALGLLSEAIEADPNLSEAYLQRASILRTLCRFILVI